jgi:hypothetical protein
MHGLMSIKFILSIFIFIFINLYMFRATMCPSSGDTAVFMRHLVLVILCLECRMPAPCIPVIHSTKCRTNTSLSPDDGHIVVRNM